MSTIKTIASDLGHGWFASLDQNADGTEAMTIRNPDKGQRINLPDASVKLLRDIFAKAETAKDWLTPAA